MDKSIKFSTLDEAAKVISELQETVSRHEQLLENIINHFNLDVELLTYWTPPKESVASSRLVVVSDKVRRIKADKIDVVDKLRETWFGRLYTDKLKSYSFFRWFLSFAWRNGYPIYINYISPVLLTGASRYWRPLTSLNAFVARAGLPKLMLADSSRVITPAPVVYPASNQSYLISPHEYFEFPEIFVTVVSDAVVYGGTNLIKVGGEVIHHDLYDFSRDFTSEELHGRTLIDRKRNRIRWLMNDDSPESVPLAANFVDACAPNYAHWMTEVLSRIVLFCADERFKHVALIVNDGLHKNIMESIYLAAGIDREIILLPIGRALKVNKLYVTSVAGYVPFERHNEKLNNHSHGVFSGIAFDALRSVFQTAVRAEGVNSWPEKIYLRRNSGSRKIINSQEIEHLMLAKGFSIVQPEKLNFVEQVQLFSNAKVIVASSGAALANIIFCPPSAQIYIFISKYPGTSYWYWQNMAAASGKAVQYFFGEAASGDIQGIHDDFCICKDEVTTALALRGVF